MKIIEVLNDEDELCYLQLDYLLEHNQIEAIVTKEQFESTSYKLREED